MIVPTTERRGTQHHRPAAATNNWRDGDMLKFTSRNDVNAEYKCIVRLLDDAEVLECDVQPRCKAQYLLDYVCEQLDILEKDYFGLRYIDHRKQRKWLDFEKSIANQIRDLNNFVLCFRVKFYPPDPMRLQEATRYQLYLQLKRDLQHGRLYSPGPGHDLAFLAALCLQEQLGDYDAERHLPGYVAEMNLVLNQSEKLETQVEDFHSGRVGALVGITRNQAVNAFLRKAATLDTYGIDPHPVKDPRGVRLYIGTNHSGVATFHNGRRTHHFRWVDISKLNYEGKMFIIHIIIMEDARTKKKHTVGFKCASSSACRLLWRYSVEQRIFFTFSSSADIPAVVTGGSFFSRGSKVRYSGRVERELADDYGLDASLRSGGGQASENGAALNNTRRSRSQREMYASRRSASEPIRDYDEGEEEDDEDLGDDDLSVDHQPTHHHHHHAARRHPHARSHSHSADRTGRHQRLTRLHEDALAEGHDSYDASSCGSGSQDDRSDVASWVAFDFRHLRGRSRAAAAAAGAAGGGVGGGSTNDGSHNGFDTLTIDSDFYGYAASATGSASADPATWSLHPGDRDSWRERDHSGSRHSASPGRHFLHERFRDDDSWTDSGSRRRMRTDPSDQALRAVPGVPIPLPPPTGMMPGVDAMAAGPGPGEPVTSRAVVTAAAAAAASAGPFGQCKVWTKRILLLGTSLFTAFSFMALTLMLVYETDFHWAIHLRHWPEMVFIQRHLYMPFRNLFPL